MLFNKIVFHVNFLNDDLAVFTQKKKPAERVSFFSYSSWESVTESCASASSFVMRYELTAYSV